MGKQNINTLMRKYLLGQATEQESAELKARADEDTLRDIIQSEDFADTYHIYTGIDKQTALDNMLRRMGAEEKRPLRWRHSLKYAAAILILVVGGTVLWYSQYTKVTPPEISESVQLAMKQSRESGKNSAEVEYSSVDVSNTKEDNLVDVILRRLDKSTSDDSQSDYQPTITKEDLLAASRVTTNHDKEFWLTLDDGTVVHLNYNTRLIYPEKFGRGDRNVILDGEAYFMVAKDKSRPFIVHTMQGDVRVYGTEFYVNTRAENSSMEVALVKGSVGVRSVAGREQHLVPGEQATVTGSLLTVRKTDIEPFIAWNEGKFAFQEWELEHVMEVLSRWYGYKVEYQSEEVRHEIIDGFFSRYSDLRATLDGLEAALDIKITIDNQTIIINK